MTRTRESIAPALVGQSRSAQDVVRYVVGQVLEGQTVADCIGWLALSQTASRWITHAKAWDVSLRGHAGGGMRMVEGGLPNPHTSVAQLTRSTGRSAGHRSGPQGLVVR